MTRGHLRLLPKPLAKCEAPREYPAIDGVSMRRAAIEGCWLVEKTRAGRTTTLSVTVAELQDLITAAGLALAMEDK